MKIFFIVFVTLTLSAYVNPSQKLLDALNQLDNFDDVTKIANLLQHYEGWDGALLNALNGLRKKFFSKHKQTNSPLNIYYSLFKHLKDIDDYEKNMRHDVEKVKNNLSTKQD